MTINESCITLSRLHFYSHHGVGESEQKVGGHYTVDLTLTLASAGAAQSDRLEDTVDYAAVYGAVKEQMLVPSRLIEHVAGRIARTLLARFPLVTAVKVSVAKHNPPMCTDGGSATVTLCAVR